MTKKHCKKCSNNKCGVYNIGMSFTTILHCIYHLNVFGVVYDDLQLYTTHEQSLCMCILFSRFLT